MPFYVLRAESCVSATTIRSAHAARDPTHVDLISAGLRNSG
jgi:hypothetical protein